MNRTNGTATRADLPESFAPRTNGDRVQPVVDREWAREHPDELAVTAAPFLMLTMATRRHKLGVAEAVLISEVAYWGGLAMCAQYRQWKTRPVRPSTEEVV